ncbi:MAG: N-acetylmuramoyl-L-alanine amidase family protein [Eubacterium sp.]|nr:N-acetylmuramoyl-L-alanine amidase family protein [Eubacterium sp.]
MDYAPVQITDQYGYPMFKSVFGESTNALGYRVNGGMPSSPNEAISNGDIVEFYFYQDDYFYSDKYTFFDKREAGTVPGGTVTLTLNVEDYDEDWNPVTVPVADMLVTDEWGNELGVTDENGQVTLSYDAVGTYGVTAVGMYENDYDEYDIFAPWCTVQVYNDYITEEIQKGGDYLVSAYESFSAADAVRFAAMVMTGYDMSAYGDAFADSVAENLAKNGGLLKSPYSGKEDVGFYGAVIVSLKALGYDPSDFKGYDIAAAYAAADITEAKTHPYYYRFAIEAADSEKGKALCQDLIDNYYKMGKGLYNGVFCCDNTSYFLMAIAKYADDFSDYVEDAKNVIRSYTRENGAYNDDAGMVTEVNANSTALAMGAFAAVGDTAGAFRYYKNLVEGFEGNTGIFQLDDAGDYFATADAVVGLGYFRKATDSSDFVYPDHVWKTTVQPATYTQAGKETKECVFCGETEETVLPKLVKNGWLKENGSWYYYKKDVAQKYWQQVDGKWYYLNSKGVMITGWLKIKGSWYYFDNSGAMATGWKKVNGSWYYMDENGAMVTGWKKLGGKWYYLSSNGAMATGWKYINGKWYYFNTNGDMKTGWLKESGSWYYLNANGDMRTANLTQGGKTYRFNNSGVCLNP